MLNQSSIAHNQAIRETLDRQIEEFLNNGGKVKELPGFTGKATKAPAPPSFLTIAKESSSVAKRIRKLVQISGLSLDKLAMITGIPAQRLTALMTGEAICTQHCVESIAMAIQAARLSPVPL